MVRESPDPRGARRLRWLLGGALLAGVVAIALHFSEGREFVRLREQAQPSWLLLAVLLQAATYLAQAEVFRGAPRGAGFSLARRWLYGLSLTKLFLDQD
jgi:Mg2+-importing ATPase